MAAGETAEEKRSRPRGMFWLRLKGVLLALVVPLALLLGWHLAVKAGMTRLIPSPADVAEYMVDFAVGGIWDDAFSATLHIHLFASKPRV